MNRQASDWPVLQTLLDGIADGILLVDPQGRLTFLNARARRFLGSAPLDIPPAEWSRAFGLYLPDEVTPFPADALPITRALRGEAVTGVQIFARPPGAQQGMCFEANAIPLTDEQSPGAGANRGAMVVLRDITETRARETEVSRLRAAESSARAEAQAAESQTMALLDSISDGFTALDFDWRILDLSDKGLRIGRITRQQVQSARTLWELFPGSLGTIHEESLRRAMIERVPVSYEGYYPPHDRWYEVHAYPSPDGLCLVYHDVTERKQTEQRLIESEKQYRFLFERNPQPMWILEMSSLAILDANQAALRHYGYTREEFLSMTACEIRPPEDVPGFLEYWRSIAKAGPPGEVQPARISRHQKKDGSLIQVEITRSSIFMNGRPAMLVAATDVTERERTRQTLLESQEKYRLLFDRSPQPLFVFDPETFAILEVNEAAVRHYGYSREEFTSMTVMDLRTPEEATAFLARFRAQRSLADPAASPPSQLWRHRKKDGAFIYVEITRNTLTVNGRAAYLVTINDVTERKRAEDALLASEAKFRNFFNDVPDGLYTCTAEGVILAANQAFVRMLGYACEAELKQCNLGDLCADERQRQGIMDRLQNGGELHDLEVTLKRKDGHELVALQNAHAVHDDRGIPLYYQAALMDITERRRLEEQLRNSHKMEAVGRLAGGIAHDFNNLLTLVMGHGHLLLEDLPAESPSRELVGQIVEAAEYGAGLTRQLLAFSRKQIVQPQMLDLNALVTNMDRMLRRVIGEDVEIKILNSRQPAVMVADPVQIEQVILNLVVNARDAMPNGGAITVEISSSTGDGVPHTSLPERAGKWVGLAVSDTGTGMTAETMSHIFEPFFTTKEPGKGTGLGLSIIYGIVQQLGGEVSVESRPGEGTSVRVFLPEAETPFAPPRSGQPAPRPHGAETLLVVEDNARVRGLIRSMLTKLGYQVLEAASAREAIEITRGRTEPIDLLLSDVVMPGMPGDELARALRADRPDLRVLHVSAHADAGLIERIAGSANTAYLQKPFSPSDLARRVRELLDMGKAATSGDRTTLHS